MPKVLMEWGGSGLCHILGGLEWAHLKRTCKVHKKILQYDVADVFVVNSLIACM